MPIDYSKGKIYQIVDYTNDNVYIGSTCEPSLARRLANHVNDYQRYLNGKKNFVTSYKIIENDNYDIQLIELYPCETKDELHKREGEHIRNTENCVNKLIAGRTRKQYKEDHKEQIEEYGKHYQKKYCEQHKDEIKEYKKQYREQHKDEIKENEKKYREQHKDEIKEKKKQYYVMNKQKITEKKKKYAFENKQKTSEYCKQKTTCECGSEITIINKSRHEKSNKHKISLSKQNN
jgi:hypothetical protein